MSETRAECVAANRRCTLKEIASVHPNKFMHSVSENLGPNHKGLKSNCRSNTSKPLFIGLKEKAYCKKWAKNAPFSTFFSLQPCLALVLSE